MPLPTLRGPGKYTFLGGDCGEVAVCFTVRHQQQRGATGGKAA